MSNSCTVDILLMLLLFVKFSKVLGLGGEGGEDGKDVWECDLELGHNILASVKCFFGFDHSVRLVLFRTVIVYC